MIYLDRFLFIHSYRCGCRGSDWPGDFGGVFPQSWLDIGRRYQCDERLTSRCFIRPLFFCHCWGLLRGLFSCASKIRRLLRCRSPASCCPFLLSLFAFSHVAIGGNTEIVNVARWINSGNFGANWQLRFDTLTAVMLIVIAGVSSYVLCCSVSYMHHDRCTVYGLSPLFCPMRYWFTADNLVQLFLWLKVGVASYLLIGFGITRKRIPP